METVLVPAAVRGEQRWGNKDPETWLNCTKPCSSYKKYIKIYCVVPPGFCWTTGLL